MYVIDMCIPGHAGWDDEKYLGVIIPSCMTWNTHTNNITSNIESVDTGKYLGVIIPSSMTWNTHINNITSNIESVDTGKYLGVISKVFSCIY
jgi:hypothetical protein